MQVSIHSRQLEVRFTLPAKIKVKLLTFKQLSCSSRLREFGMANYKIVLVRHGESVWNKENRFTGWTDVDLSDFGVGEAIAGAKMLKEAGYTFDVAFTSVLKRAVKTLNIVLDELDLHWIPVHKHWRLNERHYGALQGLNKSETAVKHSEEQVKIWRRSYDTPPPQLEVSDPRWPGHDRRYQDMDKRLIPTTECLKDTVERVLPYWYDVIVPAIKSGQRVLISAHGNSLRALVKYLDSVSDSEIVELNIPTDYQPNAFLQEELEQSYLPGIPLVYELNGDLTPIKHYYMASDEEIKAALEKVAAQGKAKK